MCSATAINHQQWCICILPYLQCWYIWSAAPCIFHRLPAIVDICHLQWHHRRHLTIHQHHHIIHHHRRPIRHVDVQPLRVDVPRHQWLILARWDLLPARRWVQWVLLVWIRWAEAWIQWVEWAPWEEWVQWDVVLWVWVQWELWEEWAEWELWEQWAVWGIEIDNSHLLMNRPF